jgi:hypothetical protein
MSDLSGGRHNHNAGKRQLDPDPGGAWAPATSISLGSARFHHEGTKVTKKSKTRDTARATNNNKENNKELWVVYD